MKEKKLSLKLIKKKNAVPSSKMHFNSTNSHIIHLRQISPADEVEKLKFYTNNEKVARKTAAPVIYFSPLVLGLNNVERLRLIASNTFVPLGGSLREPHDCRRLLLLLWLL